MTKSDLISRADAIKTIHRYKHRLEGRGQTYGFLLEEVENRIPSAETHGVCSNIIRRADVVRLLVERYKFTTSEATEILSQLPSAELPKGDLISRSDAIDAICKVWCYTTYGMCPHDDGYCKGCDEIEAIDALPSAEAETVDCTEFIRWLTEIVMDDEMWELNAVGNGEIICRKLKKLGLLEVKDGYYILPSADAVQGEWVKETHHHKDDEQEFDYYDIHCSVCGAKPQKSWALTNYCPYCGTKMNKGGDDE